MYVKDIYNLINNMSKTYKNIERGEPMRNQPQMSVDELKSLAKQLQKLKELNPKQYYEYKGRINALYENETEKRALTN